MTVSLDIPAYVKASALLAGMSLTEECFAGTCAVMGRLAAFADDVADFELGNEVEIAGFSAP